MSDIKWEDGAVCFAHGGQRLTHDGSIFNADTLVSDAEVNGNTRVAGLDWLLIQPDFQLNEIRQGDCVEVSELDTEQKYNDAVVVFELFGFSKYRNHNGYDKYITSSLVLGDGFYCYSTSGSRKITYLQLMAIGKLKRAMIEKSAPKISPELTPDDNCEAWPQVGDDAVIESDHYCSGVSKIKYLSNKFIIFSRGDDEHSELVKNCKITKPKTQQELKIDELHAKLVNRDCNDSYLLACDIVQGMIEGLSYD